MHGGLWVSVHIRGDLAIPILVDLRGPLDHGAVQHGRVALHHVVVTVVSEVHTVLPQQWFDVVDEQVHHGDVTGLGASVVGVEVHGSVSVEDDPGSDCAVHGGQVCLQPQELLGAHRVVVLGGHAHEVDQPHVVAEPGLVVGGGGRHGQHRGSGPAALPSGVAPAPVHAAHVVGGRVGAVRFMVAHSSHVQRPAGHR